MAKYVLLDSNGNVTGFYADDVHTTIPSGALPISDSDWQTYLNDQVNHTFDPTGKLQQVPAAQLLANAIRFQIGTVTASFNQALGDGFTSSANGTATTYAYASKDQTKWMKLFISMNSNIVTYPVTVFTASGTTVQLTQAQLQQLIKDIYAWEWGLENKLHSLITQIQAAATVSAVQAITW